MTNNQHKEPDLTRLPAAGGSAHSASGQVLSQDVTLDSLPVAPAGKHLDQTLVRPDALDITLASTKAGHAPQDATRASARPAPTDDMTVVRDWDLPANEPTTGMALPASLTQIGDCMIVKKLGEGGMGVVYKAVRLMLKRTVALKVLPPHLSQANPGLVKRFLIEAQSAARLAHPNIVTVYNVGQDGEYAFIEMEMVDGLSLEDHLENGPLSEYETRRVAVAIATALAYAHDQGVMHRDVKPANILMTHDGQLKLSDFGLAAAINLPSSHEPTSLDNNPPAQTRLPGGSAKITRAGSVIGTLGYMSPEQLAAKPVDGRTDIFALGVTLYVLLTDQSPYLDTAESMIQLKERLYPPSDLRQANPKVSEAFADIIHKAMANDIEYRYQNCHEMLRDLSQLAADRHTDNNADGNANSNSNSNGKGNGNGNGNGKDKEFWNSFSQMMRGIRPKEYDSPKDSRQ